MRCFATEEAVSRGHRVQKRNSKTTSYNSDVSYRGFERDHGQFGFGYVATDALNA